jgi:penicillin-binding protein 1A
MQLYAEEAVARHMAYLQREFNKQSNIKTGSVWKDFSAQLELAIKQTDRWRNAKKEDLEDAEIRKTFDESVNMRVFAWNKNRFIDTIMTPLDSLKYHKQILQTGFLAVDPFTGEVKAWVGGVDFKTFKYDHVNINTRRQVGSTIKPLLYSLAIEKSGFTPFTIVQDQQQNFEGYGMVPNTTRTCTGLAMPMAQALAESRNCASAYIMKQIDGNGNEAAKQFVEYLKKCNVQADIPAYPSLALGAVEISLYEMVQAYTMFPGGGYNAQPLFINRIEDKNGNVLESFSPQRRKVINETTAYSVVSMMQGVISKGTGRSLYSYDIKAQSIAGKTGTTNDNSDLWFMGYTPQILAGAWVGCDDRYIRFTDNYFGQGAHASLPIWAYFMNKVTSDPACNLDPNANFDRPSNMAGDFNIDFVNADSTELDTELPTLINDEEIKGESDYEIPAAENTTVEKSATINTNTTATQPIKSNPPSKKETTNKEGQKPKAIFPVKKKN